jgi:hypothetical protein
MIEKTIWITRECGSSIVSGGLKYVYVWFHEPCLEVELIRKGDIFDEDLEADKLTKDLQGILFSRNCIHNFKYYGEIGERLKLLTNTDEMDEFPEILSDLLEQRKVRFKHEIFGGGHKQNHRKNCVVDYFGYDSEISKIIWAEVVKDFVGEEELDDKLFRSFSDIEKQKQWWRFCFKMNIKLSL